MQLSDYCRSDFIEAAQPGLQFYGALKIFMRSKNKWHLLNAIWQRRLHMQSQKRDTPTKVMIDHLALTLFESTNLLLKMLLFQI